MNYSKIQRKKLVVILITVIAVLATIVCAVYCHNKSKKEQETYSPVGNYLHNRNNESTENIERIIAVLPSSNETEENTATEVNNNVNRTNTTSTNNTTISTSKYYIKVNYGANVVTIYTKDSNGNYTVPLKAMICSTGTDTPRSGVYKIDYKYRWLSLFGNVYGQYCTRIVGNILFHSVPYLEKGNPASLEYWEYDKLGTSASMGCIRLKVTDAMWIYNNCPSGTMVEFYSSSNPGPLGKPTATKISGYASPYRNWDPTDPDSSNPWRNPPTSSEETNNTVPESNTIIDNSNNVENNTIDNNINENVVNNTIDNNTDENVVNNTISNNIDENIIENNIITGNDVPLNEEMED